MTTQSITKPAAGPQATVAATGRAGPSAGAGALPRTRGTGWDFHGATGRPERDPDASASLRGVASTVARNRKR